MRFTPPYAAIVSLGLSLTSLAHADDTLIKLTTTQLKTAGITVVAATASDSQSTTGNTLRLTGRTSIPNRNVAQVSATISGQVQAVLVNVGEAVRAGSALVRIYSPELLQLERSYLTARSQAVVTQNKLQRDAALFKDGIIAQSRLDESRAIDQQAQAALQEQQQLLKLAGLSTKTIAALTEASQINPTLTLSAPITGLVLEQQVTPGIQVDAGTPLFQVGNTQTLWVELQAAQNQWSQLHIGNRAQVVGCQTTGKIVAISPQVSKDSQTALVRAEFTHIDACLRPNQYAEVDIAGRGDGYVVSIPSSALLRSSGKDYVFVQTDAGFKQQEVTVKARQNQQVWVSDDLPVGSKVAISGIAALRGAASGLGPEETGSEDMSSEQ